MSRAPLVAVSVSFCHRDLKPGNVKRVMWRGPLVGYYLCCPACAWSATYLESDVGFVEIIPPAASPRSAILVGFDRPPPCARCARILRVVGEELEASEAA